MQNKLLGQKIIEDKKKYLFPDLKMHFYENPPVFKKGHMQYLYDVEGKEYVDFFAGVSVMICGHSNEEILRKTTAQLKKLQHITIIYLDENITELAKALSNVMPKKIEKTFFCCTGSEANEGALLLSKLYTKKNKFITLENALHGRTYLTLGATTIKMWDIDPFPCDLFYVAKGFYNDEDDIETSSRKSIESIKNILDNNNDIASLIVEPIQGNGGILMPPNWYFKELKELLSKYGVLLIADEVQTGFGRTGEMFAVNHFKIEPDILVTAKALSGGIPISAFSTTSEIAKSYNKPSASTFGGNPVACVNSLAVLEYIKDHNLVTRTKRLGIYLQMALNSIQSTHIKEVRGMGLMIGMELKGENKTKNLDIILEEMKNRGYILGKCGVNRNVIAFQPPLVISEQNIKDMVQALKETMGKYLQ